MNGTEKRKLVLAPSPVPIVNKRIKFHRELNYEWRVERLPGRKETKRGSARRRRLQQLAMRVTLVRFNRRGQPLSFCPRTNARSPARGPHRVFSSVSFSFAPFRSRDAHGRYLTEELACARVHGCQQLHIRSRPTRFYALGARGRSQNIHRIPQAIGKRRKAFFLPPKRALVRGSHLRRFTLKRFIKTRFSYIFSRFYKKIC